MALELNRGYIISYRRYFSSSAQKISKSISIIQKSTVLLFKITLIYTSIDTILFFYQQLNIVLLSGALRDQNNCFSSQARSYRVVSKETLDANTETMFSKTLNILKLEIIYFFHLQEKLKLCTSIKTTNFFKAVMIHCYIRTYQVHNYTGIIFSFVEQKLSNFQV